MIKFFSIIFVNRRNRQISRHDVHPRGLSGVYWDRTKLTACFANIKLAFGEGEKSILKKLIAIVGKSAKNAEQIKD